MRAKSLIGMGLASVVVANAAAPAATILNPSFESVSAGQASSNILDTQPGNIDNWTEALAGGARYGSITSASPFGPGGPPAGSRWGALGTTGGADALSIQQTASGFDPAKVYSFIYQAKNRNDGFRANLAFSLNGTPLLNTTPGGGTESQVTAFGSPGSATPVIRFSSAGSGDRTVFFDNLSVREFSDVGSGIVKNRSFEIDDRANFDGNGYGNVSGWNGASGMNTTAANGPFADNGVIPATAIDAGTDFDPGNRNVLFRQGTGNVSQLLSGLVVGQTYTLSYQENVRNCCGGTLLADASVGGTTVIASHAVTPVLNANPYALQSADFLVTAGMVDANGQSLLNFGIAATGDASWLLDNVSITPVPEPASLGLLALGAVGLLRRRRA